MNRDMVFVYIEDDPKSRDIMRVLLQRVLGFPNVFIYEDSSEFMMHLDSLPARPDLVFLDIHMKPYDGFTVLESLRNHPDYQDLLVVALTASVMNEEVTRLKTAGFNGALAKPIDQVAFPELLEAILDGETVWHIR
jgi:CheY-like chemotaxis protein